MTLKLKLRKLHGKSALDYRLYRKANNVLIKCALCREDANLITLQTNKHKSPMKPEICGAMQWLRRFVSGLSPRKHRFDPMPVHTGYVAGKVALGLFIFPRVLWCSAVSIISLVLHTLSRISDVVILATENR